MTTRLRAYREEPHMILSNIAAYHEAGHAVVAATLGMRVGRVTIRPEGEHGGRTEIEHVDFMAASVDDRIMVHLAGNAGTWLTPAAYDVSAVYQGTRDDLDAIYALLGSELPDELVAAQFDATGKRLADLLHQERTESAIHALAGMLLEREEVNAYTEPEVAKLLIHLHP
jgi:hypothetical protein